MVQGVFGGSQAGWMWGMTELGCCTGIKRSFSNKCNYTNMLEPCVLFNSCPRKEAFLGALLLSESKRYPSASGILSASSVPWVATNIGPQIPLKNSYPCRSEGILCQAGISELAEPLLPCRPHRQLALLAVPPCPGAPWHFCLLRCLCSMERILLQLQIFPKESVRALSASPRGRSWAGAGGH